MVELAQQREVRQVGQATPNPPIQMMGLGEDRVATAGEPATTVPTPNLPPLGCGGEATLAALIHGVPVVIVDRDDKGGVTGQPAHCLETEQSTSLQVAHQRGGVTGLVDQGGQRCMEDRKERARSVATARTARGPGPEESEEGVVLPLIPGRLAVAGQRLGLRLDGCPHLGELLHGELHRHGVAGLVEARRADGSPSLARPVRSASERSGHLAQLRHRVLAGARRQLPVGLGRGQTHDGAHLVEADVARAQRSGQMG